MATKADKESLFDDYFHISSIALKTFEAVFDVSGVWERVFGVTEAACAGGWGFAPKAVEQTARQRIRESAAWRKLSDLYDYAIDGLVNNAEPTSLVIGGAEVISLIRTENHWPDAEWDNVIARGDGRFALDEGEDVLLEKVALLASVDVRTVRNAISAGELSATKSDGDIWVDNASARRWLHGRRGFKPTVMPEDGTIELQKVSTPAHFAAFLIGQRKKLGMDTEGQKLTVFHPSVNAQALSELEGGVFNLPIDAAFPIADFYQVDRKDFLECVMRVFFEPQLQLLQESHSTQGR